jgi:hypothetical protein
MKQGFKYIYIYTHTYTHTIKFVQYNLRHSKAASASLCQQVPEGKADIALIQKTWVNMVQVRALINSWRTIYSVEAENNARHCIYVRNHINVFPLLEFCPRDATTARIAYTYGGGCRDFLVASTYLPYDSDEPPPTKEVRDITDSCHSRKKKLIIGCDANAHHTVWGSTGSNTKGESLIDFLVSSNLNILNHAN